MSCFWSHISVLIKTRFLKPLQGWQVLVAQLCPTLCDPVDCIPPGSSVHGIFPGKDTGVGCHCLLQGIFPTQGSNLGLLHCRQILYHLSHQGSHQDTNVVFNSSKDWVETRVLSRGWFIHLTLLQEGGPFQGPKLGSCLTLRNELIVRGDTCVDKARDFIGKGHMGGEQQGKGTQENCSVTWLAVSGFMVMGLVSGLSLANHSDSESFLVVHSLFSQDACQREGFWEVVGQVVSPFDLSRTLLVGGGLLVPYSLPGPPVVKQLMQIVNMVPGHGGRFQSVCFP